MSLYRVRAAIDVTPSASRLTTSLRDIGYEFPTAVADLVDNSVSAGASRVDVVIDFAGAASTIFIADDGSGMTDAQLSEALRFGTRRAYVATDLGRYGLGLKTASISQARRVTVVTQRARNQVRLSRRTLDIDHIAATDRWEITDPPSKAVVDRAKKWLKVAPGTVVVWENLDRILPEERPDGGWARRRFEQLASKTSEYLGMVFHRFIEGQTPSGLRLTITVNGEKVRPWNPFAEREPAVKTLPMKRFEISTGSLHGYVRVKPFVLPPRAGFSNHLAWERASGPLKWNRQQGLYLYRANRLVQGGGWCGLRAQDEHTKLARVAIDFDTELDELFQINVAKMRVVLPAELRSQLERPVTEVCHEAEAVYRRDAVSASRQAKQAAAPEGLGSSVRGAQLGSVVVAAALAAGEQEAIFRIMEQVRASDPASAAALGW